MNKSPFLQTLNSGRILFLDGAMGTMLQAAGMPPGSSPEKFCVSNPGILKGIHLDYLRAGANIITTCTFGANPFKMPSDLDVREYNRQMAMLAREALRESGREGPLFVAGDVGPSGLFARPLGDLEPEAMIDGFSRQISGLAAGGVDVIIMETQFDLAELRLAIVAARRVCDLPVMAAMTFERGVTLTGSSPEIFAETTQNLGCAVIGSNCSLGPDEMAPVIADLLSFSSVPVMAEPNAGMPELRDGQTIFPLGPEAFASKTAAFAQQGVQILGGCCGTTPSHISALVQACSGINFQAPSKRGANCVALTSRSQIVRIGSGQPLAIIGERINPTGKPGLADELKEGVFDKALRLADEQIADGASALDVNVGAPLVDEQAILPQLTSLLVSRYTIPLSLDSPDTRAIERALPFYPGSCLVNSISGEAGRMESLGPVCRNFGAPAILLPLAGANIPVKARQRIEIVEKLLAQAEAIGLKRRLLMVDALALSVSSSPDAGKECIEFIRWCAANGLATTIGLSNISFGLPGRDLLNAAFLALATGAGLCSCIANPGAAALARTRDAIASLLGHDWDNEQFIAKYADFKNAPAANHTLRSQKAVATTLYDAILHGDRENVLSILEKEIAAGKEPFALVNEVLIPAITEVGSKYEKREYFLPQLVRSAETMQKAFGLLRPLLEKSGGKEKRPVVVMATVEGDIHDIGKNIVSLLLGNHGFDVIDAGKDVPAARILACAREHGAALIGLSALMTTTMTRMEDTIQLIKKENLPIRVMVGGAAVTQAFADSIGADAYCEDAVATVAAAKRLLAA